MLLQMNTENDSGSYFCQSKGGIFILWLPHIPIKTWRLHFQACCINVIHRVKRDRWWSETLMWQCCAMVPLQPVPMKKSSQHHPRPDYIYQYTFMCLFKYTFMWAAQSCMWPHLLHHLLLMPKHWEVICGNRSKTCTNKNELPSYLFIQAFLSITAIIKPNSFKFWENEECIPSNFQFGSGNYGHDECLNSPSSSSHFS